MTYLLPHGNAPQGEYASTHHHEDQSGQGRRERERGRKRGGGGGEGEGEYVALYAILFSTSLAYYDHFLIHLNLPVGG